MWVAREENGLLRLYTKLPYRYDLGVWRIPDDGDCVTISDEDYPQFKDLKWENEPVEVTLTQVKPIKHISELWEEWKNTAEWKANSVYITFDQFLIDRGIKYTL